MNRQGHILTDQPPFFERLPGFFLLRVATPRSRLTRWPRPCVRKVTPGNAGSGGVNLRSASVTILLPISGSRKIMQSVIKPQECSVFAKAVQQTAQLEADPHPAGRHRLAGQSGRPSVMMRHPRDSIALTPKDTP